MLRFDGGFANIVFARRLTLTGIVYISIVLPTTAPADRVQLKRRAAPCLSRAVGQLVQNESAVVEPGFYIREQFAQSRDKLLFNMLLVQMRSCAFALALKFRITLPYCPDIQRWLSVKSDIIKLTSLLRRIILLHFSVQYGIIM